MEELTIEQIRAKQIYILDQVVEFCEQNKINYFLCGGTLIGAVRHKGYIPWDDDIDLMMLRDDYERLVREFNHPDMTLLSHKKFKNYFYPFVKISDDSTLMDEVKFTNDSISMGVNIDVFPIDSMPNNSFLRRLFVFRMVFIRKCLRQKRYRFGKKILESVLRYIARVALTPISIPALCRSLTRVGQKYNKKNTDYKGIVVWGYGKREICLAEYFKSSVKLEFEGKLYDAPVGYHGYLSHVYGDYMQLPPLHKQKSAHKFQVFLK